MPKSRTRKPKSRSTSPGDRRQRRVDAFIDGLADDYAAWAANTPEADGIDEDGRSDFIAFARGQLDTVKLLYGLLGAGERLVPNLRIDPLALPDALDALLDTDDVDDLRYYIGTLVDWVSFLEETRRWEGTAEDLEAVTELLDEEAEAVGGIVDIGSGEDEEFVPRREPTEEEALAFATSSPLVRHARALLDWVGEGRAVASDGALPPAEAAEAAALIGDGAADSDRRLARLWAALRHAELIEVDDTRAADDSGSTVRLGEDAARLGSGDALGRLEAQFLATEFIITTCSRALYTPEGDAVEAALATLLTRAVLEDPLPLTVVQDLAVDAPDDADPAELQTVSVVLLDELRELAALGLVDLRAGLVDVPAAALDAVYDAFESPEGDEDWEDDAD
ncbi:hypothetical protein [Sinomonas humi]|uniref:Uncharacterized protein n=1 Tax=Sinomonas humi TaxID=1338436 RepID=A0A0B2AJY8_9MICC|nr:hypothetical protein [Sinomonas humi]KHL03940.1 hypothetical protein LK10_07760 [Sinomonas humi]